MNHWTRNFILMALMLAASGMAVALRPSHKIADQGPKFDLETVIPRTFGDWREEIQNSILIVDPQRQATLDEAYSQVLTRIYVNDKGYRIMLSIAYGTDQRDTTEVHTPDFCYPAQGFELRSKQTGSLAINKYEILVTRILTNLGPRIEPVTYWTTIGGRGVEGRISKKLVEMSYGLTGKIPDGMIIRVSSIDPDTKNAYEIQNQFSAQMVQAVAPEYWQRLTGIPLQN